MCLDHRQRKALSGAIKGIAAISIVSSLCLHSQSANADDLYQVSREIAQKALAHNIVRDHGNDYLVAGGGQYKSLWVRDFTMSIGGALRSGHEKAVHDTLELIFRYQRQDGLIPRCVDDVGLTERFLTGLVRFPRPFDGPFRAWYETENGVTAIDGNAMIPWGAAKYVMATHDMDFAKKYFGPAERALQFLEENFFDQGLVAKQEPFADWEDSLRRTGKVAYTNELYILSLRGLSLWAEFIGENTKAAEYQVKAIETAKRFNDYFWMPSKKYVMNFEGDEDHITADANFMAVAYGILPPEESRDLIATLKGTPLWGPPMPGRATWPDYPDTMKSSNVLESHTAGYHDSMFWLWLTAMAAKAESALGDCFGYYDVMDPLSSRIMSDGDIWEAFDHVGLNELRPYRAFGAIRMAEHPFTWSSAVYLDAEGQGCDAAGIRSDI